MDENTGRGAATVLIGIALVAFAVLGPFSTYLEVRSHETTQAEVTAVGIASATEREEGETEVEYYPRIEYTYTVDGENYTNWRLYHPSQIDTERGELAGKEFDQRFQAVDVVEGIDNGSAILVRYDPDTPSASYLFDPSQSLATKAGGLALLGLLMGGAGLKHLLDPNW